MKKLKYILICTLLALAGSSCADFLDKEPDTELNLEIVFESETRVKEWLAGCYSSIPDPYWGYVRKLGWDTFSDDITPSERWRQFSGWDVIPKILGEWSTASSWGGNYWAELPQRLRTIYIFLENVKPIPDQKLYEGEVELMKAECRFLVAYYHYLLLDTYGPIPFKPYEIIDPSLSVGDMQVTQTPYDEIVAWIDNELIETAKLLPAAYTEGEKYGRATSIMCQAVRARMLLFAASPLVNGNSDYAGHKNRDGVELFNTTYDPKKWEYAAKACQELIDAAHLAGHDLYREYITVENISYIDPFLSYQNMMFTEAINGNKEILFARPSVDYTEYEKHCAPRGNKGAGGLGVTQSLVDAFYDVNGEPVVKDDTYYKEFITEDFYWREGYTAWAESENNTPALVCPKGSLRMYANREPRFYISVYFNNQWYSVEKRNLNFMYKKTDNDGTHDSPQNGYLVRKKAHNSRNADSKYFQRRPGILYRLGEAYLNYAEALNECDPENPEIVRYVNLIRERAGIPALPKATYPYAEMKEILKRERRVELNCEGIRYNDLRRWKEAETVLNGDFYGMRFTGTKASTDASDPEAFYVLTPYQKRVYNKKNYWFPIHRDEIDRDPKLVQSPFWSNNN